jgi:MFS family permease
MLSAALILSWFLAGMHVALVNTLVGLQAEEKKRGQVFGTLGFVMGLGSILSGFLFGQIMDAYGMQALFVLSLVISILWTVISLFYKDVRLVAAAAPKEKHSQVALGWTFVLLFGASILSWFTIKGGQLGTSILMNGLGYSAGSISTTAGVASLAALAMPLLLGWLSDRIGRKRLILGLNLLGMASMAILSQVQSLAGFWTASALLLLYSSFSGLANALTTDLVPRQSLGLGLSLITNAANFAGIISSVGLGLAFSSLGPGTTFLVALVLPAAAALLMALVKEPHCQAAEQSGLAKLGP